MFILGKLKMYLLLALVVGGVGFGLWKYYEYTQNQIRIYAENAAKAEMAQAETEAALQQTLKDLEQVQIQFEKVSKEFETAEKRVDSLEKKFADNDINYLANARPGLVEKIIDKASLDVLRCFEIESGSPLTEEEINVTEKSKANSICPDIANPNYVPIK